MDSDLKFFLTGAAISCIPYFFILKISNSILKLLALGVYFIWHVCFLDVGKERYLLGNQRHLNFDERGI